MPEEVVWNGSKDSPSRGLLCVPPETTPAAPRPVTTIPFEDRRAAVRRALTARSLTASELAARTGLGAYDVNAVLYTLPKPRGGCRRRHATAGQSGVRVYRGARVRVGEQGRDREDGQRDDDRWLAEPDRGERQDGQQRERRDGQCEVCHCDHRATAPAWPICVTARRWVSSISERISASGSTPSE